MHFPSPLDPHSLTTRKPPRSAPRELGVPDIAPDIVEPGQQRRMRVVIEEVVRIRRVIVEAA